MKILIKNGSLILYYKKPTFWIICISIVACIVVAVCFLTNPNEGTNCEVAFGTYVKNDLTGDTMLYWSGLTINKDGTFTYSPSVISSYMGVGTWTINGDYIIFNDTGMGDVRKEVFQYTDGNLYYVAAKSASNSMWGLTDGTEYILKMDITIPDYVEKNENQEGALQYSNGIEIGDIDYNGVEDFIIAEDGTFDSGKSFKWTLVLNDDEIYTAYNDLHCDFDVSFLNLDGDLAKEILVLVYPHVNSASLTEFVVLKEKGDSWVELQKVSELNPSNGYAFPIKITMGEGKPISMDISCEGIECVLNEDISKHYEAIAAGDSYFDEDGSFAKDILSSELYEPGEEFAHTSAYGIWEIKIDAENGINYLVAKHGIESNPWGKNDVYGYLDVWFNYDLSGKIKIFKIKYYPLEIRMDDKTITSDTASLRRKITDAEVISKEFSFAGASGKLTVDVTKEAITQPVEMELSLKDSNGKTVWKREQLGIVSAGWDSFYVYSYNGTDYLIEYYPLVSQGEITYSFRMYEFDAKGNAKIVDERYATTSDEVTVFLNYTKQYMDKAQLFISTINGVITTGI